MGMLHNLRQLDAFLHSCQSDSRGGRRWPTSTFPCMEWIVGSWHVPGWSQRMNHQSCGHGTRGGNLVFGRWSHKQGLSYTSARDIGFSLTGPVNWARRTAQAEVTLNTVQEAHWAIAEAVIEKKMKARGPGCPWGFGRAIHSSFGTCNVYDWMGGLNEGASNREMRRTGDSNAQCVAGHGPLVDVGCIL